MAREDNIGLFWEDVSKKVIKKEDFLKEQNWVEPIPGYWVDEYIWENGEAQPDQLLDLNTAYALVKKTNTSKAVPPEPVWLAPDYYPYLEEALEFNVDLFTDEELMQAAGKELLVFDIECYINYYLCAFKSFNSGKVIYFELWDNGTTIRHFDQNKLLWVIQNFTIGGFNSAHYDIWILFLSLAGFDNQTLKYATAAIIEQGERGSNICKSLKAKQYHFDHIDIKEVMPLSASLKLYSGRLHCKKMQDLPYDPGEWLDDKRVAVVRYYCINDLDDTILLFRHSINPKNNIMGHRLELGEQYGIDLRSKSDAQIAEAVLGAELKKHKRVKYLTKPKIAIGTGYKYRVPRYMKFQTPLMQGVLDQVKALDFIVGEKGSVEAPEALKACVFTIGNTEYKLQIGGLHSREKKMVHYTDKNHILVDKDVTSYYPNIILILQLFPQHLGAEFLTIYNRIVDTRIAAKAARLSAAQTLKIVINGSYGKLGSKWSILYSPDLVMQVTLTGQLTLLMLIEALELEGIPVVSGNTDGVVIKCPRHLETRMEEIAQWWQDETGFKLESTYYDALFSRDVNNYIAIKSNRPDIKQKPGIKGKGAYADPGIDKNPSNLICIQAVKDFLMHKIPIEDTIHNCQDFTKFITVRTVKGGAVKVWQNGIIDYLGKAIRWYYGSDPTPIVYAKTGNKVPKSDGASPCMDLPGGIPDDLNYEWYIREARSILKDIGASDLLLGCENFNG